MNDTIVSQAIFLNLGFKEERVIKKHFSSRSFTGIVYVRNIFFFLW